MPLISCLLLTLLLLRSWPGWVASQPAGGPPPPGQTRQYSLSGLVFLPPSKLASCTCLPQIGLRPVWQTALWHYLARAPLSCSRHLVTRHNFATPPPLRTCLWYRAEENLSEHERMKRELEEQQRQLDEKRRAFEEERLRFEAQMKQVCWICGMSSVAMFSGMDDLSVSHVLMVPCRW